MDEHTRFIGIDVSKEWLDLAERPSGEQWRVANDEAGWAAVVAIVGPPTVRRFLTSTTTCLLRPWLKLWRTTPVSVRGLSDKVSFFSPGVLVSLIPYCFLVHHPSAHSIRLHRSPAQSR